MAEGEAEGGDRGPGGQDEDPTTRTATFTRGTGGFGFKIKGLVHGDTSMEVVMQVINGRFYAPLQYVSGVDKGGVADLAGLRLNDRILEVNGQDVQGATHTRVVNIIKYGGDTVSLKVFSVTPEEAARLKRIEDILLEDKRRSVRGDQVEGTMGNTPVLSNEAQLQIFEMVKKGMNIEDALLHASRASADQARGPEERKDDKKKEKEKEKKDKEEKRRSTADKGSRPVSMVGGGAGAAAAGGAAASPRKTDVPVLSNEMQIAVFEMVKRGMTIDAALAKARMLETSFDQDETVTRDLGPVNNGAEAAAAGGARLRPEDHPTVLKLVKQGMTIDQALAEVHGRKA